MAEIEFDANGAVGRLLSCPVDRDAKRQWMQMTTDIFALRHDPKLMEDFVKRRRHLDLEAELRTTDWKN